MRMKKLYKKGFEGSSLVDMYSYIAFAITIIVFLIIFKLDNAGLKSTVDANIQKTNSDIILLNFLRGETRIGETFITNAELVQLYKEDDKYKGQLTDNLKNFFSESSVTFNVDNKMISVNNINTQNMYYPGYNEKAPNPAGYAYLPKLDGNGVITLQIIITDKNE
jgi:hypothetical protein